MPERDRVDDLRRIGAALDVAKAVLEDYTPGDVDVTFKRGDDPLTLADVAVDTALRTFLPSADEGWLSEETVDDDRRLGRTRVWAVDPIDGTREFVAGIPEWCVSIGLLENGQPVAGGVENPATGERVLGAVGHGVIVTGSNATGWKGSSLMTVAASRSEVRRGEWDRYGDAGIDVIPCGSIAYKLAMVAAGMFDATWTRSPKHEWDVAGGAALIRAAGGWVCLDDGSDPSWNRPHPVLPGLIGTRASVRDAVRSLLFD